MTETKNIIWLERDEQGVTRDEYGQYVTLLTSDGRNLPNYVKMPKEAQSTAGVSQAHVLRSCIEPCPICKRNALHYNTNASVHVAICTNHETPYIWYRENH